MVIDLVSMMKGMPDIIKAGKFHGIGECQGGSAHNAKNNMKVIYCGVINENAGEINLNSDDFKYFNPGFYNYISKHINQNLGIPSTKIHHDFVCCHEDIIFIVGEAFSTILNDKLIKNLLCLIKMLEYASNVLS